jgi:serine/threonine protein kinase
VEIGFSGSLYRFWVVFDINGRMLVSSLNCPFCKALIEVHENETLKECPSCHQKLHGPVKKVQEAKTPSGETPPAPVILKTSDSSPDLKTENIRMFGPYRIERNIGKGGMGYVYEAFDTRLNRTVALKTIESSEISEQVAQRFQQEAKHAAKLRHPNIVSIHDIGSDHGFDYFTMDFVQGVTLDRWLQNGTTTIRQRVEIIEKVARALHYAHQQGVVHRDVKPGNIMIDGSGEPQIMDFGLARNTRDGQNLTMAGSVLGTPAYISPEQASGQSRNIEAASDIWGLGVILYEILTGKPPFDNGNVYQTIYAVLHSDPDAPRKLNPKISRDLETIIVRCLEKDPTKRYASALILAEDLGAYLKEHPIQARRVGWFEKLVKSFQRKHAISANEFVLEQQARERAETQRSALQIKLEKENRKEWHLIYEEDFKRPGLEERLEIVGGEWAVENGELHIKKGTPQVVYLRQRVVGDVRIEFECYLEGEYLSDVSCFLSALPIANLKKACDSGYIFQYGANGNLKSFLQRPKHRLWEKNHAPLMPGIRYRVSVERAANRFTCMVNDEVLCRVDDPNPLQGPERGLLGLYGYHSDTHYTSFKVYRLGIPVKVDILEMAHKQTAAGKYASAMDLFHDVLSSSEDPIRKEEAKQGYEKAARLGKMKDDLPSYEKRIQTVLPKAKIALEELGITVSLGSGKLKDLELVRGLPIYQLLAPQNNLTNIEALRGCSTLRILDLGNNDLSDINPLAGLQLEHLTVSGNQLVNISALHRSSLLSCLASQNKIEDLGPLADSNLVTLDLEANEVKDLSPLRNNRLSELHICRNQIETIETLRGSKLSELYMYETRVRSLDPLKGMRLREVRCFNTLIESLDPFIENTPPDVFFFDSESLPSAELLRAAEKWKAKNFETHATHAMALYAIRQKDVSRLKSLGTSFKKHRYVFIPKFVTWTDAVQICKDLKGTLLTLSDYEEREFVRKLRPYTVWMWIGLYTENEEKKWVTGEPVTIDRFLNARVKTSDPKLKHVAYLGSSPEPHLVREETGFYKFPFIIKWNE